jgi:ferredoxin
MGTSHPWEETRMSPGLDFAKLFTRGFGSGSPTSALVLVPTPFSRIEFPRRVQQRELDTLELNLLSPSFHAHTCRHRRRCGGSMSCRACFVHILSLSSTVTTTTRLLMSTLPCSRIRLCSVSNASLSPRISRGWMWKWMGEGFKHGWLGTGE